MASCRWVRPILTISLKATAFSLSVARSACSDGITFPAGQSAPRRAWRWGIHHLSSGSYSHRHWDEFFAPSPFSAEQFTGAVGQHLVHIHIALGAGAGLPDSRGTPARAFRPALRQRRRRSPRLSPPSTVRDPVNLRRRPLGQRQGVYQLPGHFFGRDAEMLQRALGLGAPEFIGRDLDGAHRVFSLRCVVITFSLDEKCVIATKLTCLKD